MKFPTLITCFLILLTLKAEIIFRDKDRTFNRLYEFVLKDQSTILYRYHNSTEWMELPLHRKLKSIKAIASDDEYVIAIDGEDRIFTMFKGLSDDPSDFKWIKRWGAPFWFGRGMKLPQNSGWDVSFFSPAEDKYYQTDNGNMYDVGMGVTNIFYLDPDKQTVIYLDPWLPRDTSYEACSPLRGRFKSANLSSSGSTIFLIGENGDMYTRLFDFDIVGADGVFFNYSYDKKEYTVADNSMILKREIPRPLPLKGWQKETNIDGIITDRITVIKRGTGGINRTLRVEGMNKDGITGYYTKDITEQYWTFIETNLPLRGRILANGSKDKSLVLGQDKSTSFALSESLKHKYSIEINDFHPYCSPSTINITLKDGESLKLLLHTREQVRQFTRQHGLNKKALKLYGTIEIPQEIDNYSPSIQKFITETLKLKEKYTDVKTKVTDEMLTIRKFKRFKWKLKRSRE